MMEVTIVKIFFRIGAITVDGFTGDVDFRRMIAIRWLKIDFTIKVLLLEGMEESRMALD